MRKVKLADTGDLPVWRRPYVLLIVMAAAMPMAFAVWTAVLQNFVIEVADFNGSDWGWLQSVREIPGFAAIAVIVLLLFIREQVLALISLVLLGVAVALTAQFPSFQGLLMTTILSSVGFHYFETVNQSLQLQWLPRDRAPQLLGWIVATGSATSLVAYSLLVIGWKSFGLTYNFVLMTAGSATVIVALGAMLVFPQFESHEPQIKKMVLRRRYWLYYALQFMAGARRQIFVVFAAFMMVEHFGFEVHQVTALFLINFLSNMIFAPVMGRIIARFGERRALLFEYSGLICVFLAYGGIYYFGWGVILAAALYVIDHLFFALAMALKTYFQKIADPRDIAPTAAVAFTINHIAAVFLPVTLGYLWIASPGAVFGLAAGMASLSLGLALLIPRHPAPGRETVLAPLLRVPAE
ncbi:MAG: MFS transporter [Sagittula sp.]|uniref:MFS transporter n=1 Tax=Sagittula sp. TaxID=2038081 RepID=UPI004059531C